VTNLDDPFIVRLSIPEDSEIAANENEVPYCAYWDVQGSEWVADGTVLSHQATTFECSFDHLTTFGGFEGPKMNELGSVDEIFSPDSWANNVLGLAICLILLFLTMCFTVWSFCAYVRLFRQVGRSITDKGHSDYARHLVLTSYRHTKLKRVSSFTLRTNTQCGPLIWRVAGDPYVRSQRMVVVLVTVLCSLFFSALFYRRHHDLTVCSEASNCTSFDCPSCEELHGSDCGNDLPSPANICASLASLSACTTRPLDICQLGDGEYSANVRGDCRAGKLITVHEHYTGSGEQVSSKCDVHSSKLAK
jgi:hypothetical protein